MKARLLIIFSLLSFCMKSQTPETSSSDWTVTNITSNNELNYPNTIIYGPDNNLWITERVGKKVVKVSPSGGSKTVMLDLSSIVYQSAGQDGLMGMAIHPDLYSDINTPNNLVYLIYTYDDDPGSGVSEKFRIASYTYNSTTGNLNSGSETTIIDGVEASNDHSSGKIQIGPDLKIYWTVGEQAANRGSNSCNEIRSQYLPTSDTDYSDYKGKILRLNLDGSIPSDNPMLNGVISHVYTYGHRNAQGIVFGSNGKLYSSEHGDMSDDEINIIKAGKNYGWPLISGYNDDLGYVYRNWSNYPGTGTGTCGEHNINNYPGTPITESTSYASISTSFEPPIGTFNSTPSTTAEPSGSWLTWLTVAPSSINIYEGGLIPNWGKSLLIPTLKTSMILRTKLNVSGTGLEDGTYEIFHASDDRYRDIVMDPDGVTFYAITDNSGGNVSGNIANPGVVMKLQYTGTTLSSQSYLKNDFSIVPNPASNNVKIALDSNNNKTVHLLINDIHGRTIKYIKNIENNHILNISTLSNGLYFIKLVDQNNKEITTKKIIKTDYKI